MFNKIMMLEQVTIQVKKQQLIKKNISNYIIDRLLWCDPTNKDKSDTDKVGSYTDWIVNKYLKDISFSDFNKLHSQLEQYDKSKHKIPDPKLHNISQFETLDELVEYVDNNQDKLNITPNKFVITEGSSLAVFYSKQFVIHVPHTEEQSKVLGSGTKWCTSQEKDNKFKDYITLGYLFYITNKTTHQEKYNLFLDLTYDKIEFSDDKNRHLSYKLFDIVKEDNTLIPQIKTYFEYKNIKLTGQLYNFLECKTVNDIVSWFQTYVNKNASIYFEKDEQTLINIISKTPKLYQYIPNPTPQIQLQQVSKDPFIQNHIEHWDKNIQLQIISHTGYFIEDIIKRGIIPDEDVQLQQVTASPHQITILLEKNIPVSKKVQIQQVSKDGTIIRELGRSPDEDVQLQQVKQNFKQIIYITSPSEEVNLYQVSKNGIYIRFIKNPSEKIQLQQINQNPNQYDYITNPTPKQTQLYYQLKSITESTGYISKLLDVN